MFSEFVCFDGLEQCWSRGRVLQKLVAAICLCNINEQPDNELSQKLHRGELCCGLLLSSLYSEQIRESLTPSRLRGVCY